MGQQCRCRRDRLRESQEKSRPARQDSCPRRRDPEGEYYEQVADAQQRIDRHERTDLEVTGMSIADAQKAFDQSGVDVATRRDQEFGDYKARLEA